MTALDGHNGHFAPALLLPYDMPEGGAPWTFLREHAGRTRAECRMTCCYEQALGCGGRERSELGLSRSRMGETEKPCALADGQLTGEKNCSVMLTCSMTAGSGSTSCPEPANVKTTTESAASFATAKTVAVFVPSSVENV